jgi:hypothetical protein
LPDVNEQMRILSTSASQLFDPPGLITTTLKPMSLVMATDWFSVR